jgi:hypothetical protein
MKAKLYPYGSNYAIGIDGSVWKLKKQQWVRANQHQSTRGRLQVCILGKLHLVHRVVLETFIGLCPKGLEGCHNDGDHTNNCLSNLRWDTPANNMLDKIKHGNTNKGERCPLAKLTEEKVIAIRLMCKHGATQKEAAARFGIARNTVSLIVNNLRWSHI